MEFASKKSLGPLALIFSLLMVFSPLQQAKSYDATKRLSLFQDRMKAYQLLDPYNRDFYFDLRGTLNTTLFNLIKEVKAVNSLASANAFIQSNNGTEQGFGGHVSTGVPLPKFKLFRIRFSPVLQYMGLIGVNMGFSDMTFHFYNFGETSLGPKLSFRYKKRYTGFFKFHFNFKSDLKIIKSATDLALNGVGNVDIGGNLHGDLGMDIGVGYKRRKWRVNYLVEDIKLMELIASKKNGTYSYGKKPLMGLHGIYRWKKKGLTAKLLTGTHQRSGHYTWSDSFYLGGELAANTLKGKLGLSTRFIMDPEHWNVGLKLNGFIGHLDYLIKLPKKSTVDGIKVSSFHSLSLRLFF